MVGKLYPMRYQCIYDFGDWCIRDNEDGRILIRGKSGLKNMETQIRKLKDKLRCVKLKNSERGGK